MTIVDIRELRSDDADLASVRDLTGLLSSRLAEAASAASAREVAHGGPGTVLVAEDGRGRVIGMITLFVFDAFSGRHGWLEDLVVTPDARGSGAGLALMRAAVELAERNGVEKLLSCSHPRRVAANRTHLAAGLEVSESNLYRVRFGAPVNRTSEPSG